MNYLPTKQELLKTSLVDIDQHHKKVTTNTLQVALYFNKRPSEINRRIAALNTKGLCKIAPSYYLNEQGKQQLYYELNRDQFLLVVMGFTGDKADHFKADFIRLFNQQEKELLHWREQALLTSDSTKQANDQVYRLQEALKKVIPTSRRCTMLFIHLQQAITLAATGSSRTKRPTMTTSQLNRIEELEVLLQAEIKRLMDQGTEAEQVREDVLAVIKKEAQTTSVETLGKGFLNSKDDITHDAIVRQAWGNTKLETPDIKSLGNGWT